MHGHCHQKAFGALPPVLEAPRLIPGAEIGTVESSCCAMAGIFGYWATHHDVSMQIFSRAQTTVITASHAAATTTTSAGRRASRHSATKRKML